VSAADVVTVSVKVSGLRQAAENLMEIGSGETRTRIARDASRAASWVVADDVKAATYSTFNRVSGWIKSGIGVRVATGVRDNVLNAVVAELPQYAGSFNPMAKLFRAHHPGKAHSRKQPSLAQVAFYWRFLEFGTKERHAKRTPKFTYRAASKQRTKRQSVHLALWSSSPSRGGIAPRSWVRPALQASELNAVQTYESTMRERTETEIANLQK
jgi:hypothetical protein